MEKREQEEEDKQRRHDGSVGGFGVVALEQRKGLIPERKS